MSRQICCENCAKGIKSLPASEDGPEETVSQIKGYARWDFVCDLCNKSLPTGTQCIAVTIDIGSKRTPYWEYEYITQKQS